VRIELRNTVARVIVDPTYSASPCWMSRPTTDYTSGKLESDLNQFEFFKVI